MDSPSLQTYERFCIVRRGTSWFAVPALSLREVAAPSSLVAVPAAPAVVAGLCHQRNEFLVVLRLEVLAGEQVAARNDKSQMLVLAGPHGSWGLLVDEVAGLQSLEVSVNAEAKQPDSWVAAVLGSATYDGKVVHVLDVNSLYRFAEYALGQSWQAAPIQPERPGPVIPAVSADQGVPL
jgi:chemotaxis signal transduction protein